MDRHFRPRARLLQHLGDQLIGTPRLAVFELVKNAYDADAGIVEVEICGIGTDHPNIRIADDGIGMSIDTIRDIWLVIAHDHKEKKLAKKKESKQRAITTRIQGIGSAICT